MRLLFLLFIIFFSFSAFGQKISGRVNSIDGKPVPFATISVLNLSKGTISDSLGNFEISLSAGAYKIMVSAMGFSSQVEDVVVDSSEVFIEFALQSEVRALDEVIVSANKTEQPLLDIPVSVTHLSAQQLLESRTWNLEDLRALVPNYQYADLGVSYQQVVAIRGISVFSENPAIATYIDGVNAFDVTANGLQMLDVEKIEVLRGPQGTLYGRNAMGGVINIVTGKPTAKAEGFFESGVGNLGLQKYSFGIKYPICKNLLFSGISGQYEKRFGYYFNDLSNKTSFEGIPLTGSKEDGERMGDEESYFLNYYLKWYPVDQFKTVFNFKTQRDQSTGASMYYQAVENEVTAVKNPYKMAVNDLGSNYRTLLNSSVSLIYSSPKISASSITAFQYILQQYEGIDIDLFPYDLGTGSTFADKSGDPIPQRVLSQEFRLASAENNSPLTWSVGSLFFDQSYNKRYATHYKRLALLFGEQPGIAVSQNDDTNSGMAVYGQFVFHLNEKWEFTTGLRYDYEERNSLISRFRIDSTGVRSYSVPEIAKSKKFNAFSPKGVVSYKLKSRNHFYISYCRGYRVGGINASTKATDYEFYNPEFSENFELGYKYFSENKKYSVQSSAFLIYWKDLQIDYRTDNGVYVVNNIGDVNSTGLEVEAEAKPLSFLHFNASIGINHSRYQQFNFLGDDIKGKHTILAPPVTIFAGIRFLALQKKAIKLTCISECRYMGDQYFDLINTIKQPAYSVLNAHIIADYKYVSVSGWVRNITDVHYLAYAMPGYFRYSILNRPRTIGFSVKVNF